MHLYFNLIGTVVFMIVFYSLNALIGFSFMNVSAEPFGIAVIHTIFNVFATCLLLPFSQLLEKLAYLTIKEDISEHIAVRYIDEDIKVLDSRFMNNPALAMEQCRRVIFHMADTVKQSYEQAVGLLEGYNEEVVSGVVQMEKDVDRYEDVLGTYLLKLTGRELSERDSQALTLYLQSIGDFERISDHAVSIAMSYDKMEQKEMHFSSKAQEELRIFTKAIHRIIDTSFRSFQENDISLVYEVEALQAVVDDLSVEVRKRHVKRLRKGKCTIELGFLLSDIVTGYERIAAHCVHLVVNMVQIQEDSLEMHGYNEEIREQDADKLHQLYDRFYAEYALPVKEKNKKDVEDR